MSFLIRYLLLFTLYYNILIVVLTTHMKNYLEFEKEIKALEQEVDGLKSPFGTEGISEVDTQKIKNTQNEINEKLKDTYANLNSWQRTQVARHEDRPKANFYIKKIFSQKKEILKWLWGSP